MTPSTRLPSSRRAEALHTQPRAFSDASQKRGAAPRFCEASLKALAALITVALLAAAPRLPAPGGAVPAGFDLRAGRASPNLTNTSAEAPLRLESPPGPLPAVPPKPLPPEVRAVSAAPAPGEPEPSHPGESTMIAKSKPLFPVMLAAFLASSPAAAQTDGPQEKDKDKVVQEQIKGLTKKVDDLTTNILDIQKSLKELDEVRTQLAEVKGQLDKLAKGAPQVSRYGPSDKELDELRKQLADIQKTLKKWETTRVSAFPPTEGQVELRNDYPQDMQFVVNGTAYTVRPYETRVVKAPAGTFSFSVPAVPGYQAALTRTLGTEKPYVIRIFPQ